MAPQTSTEEHRFDKLPLLSNVKESLRYGRYLSTPPPGEEVVISGIAGSYPDSENVAQFKYNLLNKIDMVSPHASSKRGMASHPEIPQRSGKIDNVEKFDAGYFGVHNRQAHTMDPMARIFLEKCIAAVLDAGINPKDLEGTKTGVFVGACFSECEPKVVSMQQSQHYGLTGTMRSIFANRVSYFLKLKGPSFVCDTACSSSMYGLQEAYHAIRSGKCDAAFVGGANVFLLPFVTLQFARLGVLSADGACKCFDERGDGYARSEAISVIFLQKSKDAKRIYANLIHSKTNCDGFKENGITYPSGVDQASLLRDFYDECNIDPTSLSYLEAHSTGTKVGDPEEIKAVDEIFCKNRKTPLLVGSVKSNIGHSEPTSGLCSITKCIIGMETNTIPPNLHYKTPRVGVKALEDGRLKVVTECTPFEDNRGLIGIDNFGFGGANSHILLKWNTKTKIDKGQPKDDLPRLVCVSGRVEETIQNILNDVAETKLDAEYVKLLHSLYKTNHASNDYRGYSIVTKNEEVLRSIMYFNGNVVDLNFVFSNLNNCWQEVGNELLNLPLFSASIFRINKILSTKKINVLDIIAKGSNIVAEQLLGSIVVQIGTVEILKALEIVPNKLFGHSIGELICAYYDDALTLDETINAAVIISSFANKNEDFSKQKSLLMQDLSKIIPKPKRWSNKCISKNVEQFASAEYFVNALINKNSLKDMLSGVFKNAVLFEIGAGQLEAIASSETMRVLSTAHEAKNNHINYLLTSIGSLYELGLNPQLDRLYPDVHFPVSRGTPMINSHIKWDHSSDWYIISTKNHNEIKGLNEKTTEINVQEGNWRFVQGHVIDGRNLFPAMGYLYLVWDAIACSVDRIPSSLNITFEHCKFRRATNIPNPKVARMQMTVMIQRSGNFEIIESGTAIVTGRAYIVDEYNKYVNLPIPVGVNGIKMQTNDIYKELRLRGYNYHGKFKALQECDISAAIGTVKWEDNWIALMDNMLQMQILQLDSKLLYVPTSIDKITINAELHLKYIKKFGENPVLPIYVYKEANMIRCGHIQIFGVKAMSIALRKPLGEPVLEKYDFVPNNANLNIHQSVRVNLQIIFENFYTINLKVVELVDEATMENTVPLTEVMLSVLKDVPLIKPNLTIFSKTPIKNCEVSVEDKLLRTETECCIVIATNLISRTEVLQQSFSALKENGYIFTREALDLDLSLIKLSGANIITVHRTDKEVLILLNKTKEYKHQSVINVAIQDNEFKWLPKLQNSVKNDINVILYAQNEPLNGILGLINCVRREPGGQSVKAVFIADDNIKPFDPLDSFYATQLKKSMTINVFKNGQWGTYRHLLLENSNEIACNHSFVNSTVRGDLSSLRWMEGPLSKTDILLPERCLVQVYYSSINFRDIMTASGKINIDVITMQRLQQNCVQGFEYAGRDMQGNRVMGMTKHGSMASMVEADMNLMWKVPDSWTLEEAATVPVVYGTSVYALLYIGKIHKGSTVLIHSGSGGVGQAAIQISLHFGCTVYTTVGTSEKREFLKQRFPQLTDQHIGNSRDTSFENMIMKGTKGRGVDVVLNSLAEEKLIATVRCLARGGTFLEIGKFDMANNNTLSLLLFQKEASFHGVMLDQLFDNDPHGKEFLYELLSSGIADGAITPLPRTVFKRDEIEQAFRFMTSGKHMGKVMIQIRLEEEKNKCLATEDNFLALPKYYCKPENTYILLGGLGGFGLELADWLVMRGARKLVLTSRRGVSTGYQAMRINVWSSYGVETIVSTANVTTPEGCEKLINEAEEIGPVHAVFNLAVVLKDALLENQNKESFQLSFAPKALATKLLDEITRKRCPKLRDFVVFSSVSCGRGNAGQTNYGMANSVMERICEQRKKDGFPAVAIEWGAIGEVGIVAELQVGNVDLEIGGTLPQKISSCLNVLDIFLRQNSASIVSSMVVAPKKGGIGGSGNIVDVVANIIGVREIKSVSMHATLAELGMDSMTAVEIQQTLEREFSVFLTAKDMRSLTFNRLIEIQEQKDSDMSNVGSANKSVPNFKFVLNLMDDEENINLREVNLETKLKDESNAPKVIFLPGIESAASTLLPLTINLNCNAVAVQMGCLDNRDTVYEMAEDLLPTFEKHISKDAPFHIIAYSFGSLVALEVVNILETKGYKGKLIILDGGPQLMQHLYTKLEVHLENRFQTGLICQVMAMYIPQEVIDQNTEAIFKCSNLNERFTFMQKISEGQQASNKFDHKKTIVNSIYKRIHSLVDWKPTFEKLQSKIILLKANYDNNVEGLSEDYELSQLCHEEVEVHVIEANHVSILGKMETVNFITSIINEENPIHSH